MGAKMTDEALVEALAQRFLEIYERWPHRDSMSGEFRGFISETAHESFKMMARECLRQMEWARRPEPMVAGLLPCICGLMHVAGHPIFQQEGHGDTDRLPLKLAPEDWQP
jgi:hypothetical protein